MAALMPQGKQQYFTAGGIPLVGGKVYTYAAGTTTPLATYTDAAAGTPNTNPVILDSRGEASIFFSAANYKIVVKDSLDSTIWTQDDLVGDPATKLRTDLAASGGSALVGHLSAGTGAVATTVQAKLREWVSVLDFGANTTPGTTDMTSAIQAAADTGKSVYFPAGIYKTSAAIVPVGSQIFFGAGQNLTFVKASVASQNGFTLTSLSWVGFKDMTIQNTAATPTGAAINIVGGGNNFISDVALLSFFKGGLFTSTGTLQCNRLYVSGHASHGIHLNSTGVASVGIWLRDIYSLANTGDGLCVTGLVTGCYLDTLELASNTANGFEMVTDGTGSPSDFFVTKVICDSNSQSGFLIGTGVSQCSFDTCWSSNRGSAYNFYCQGTDISVLGGKYYNCNGHGLQFLTGSRCSVVGATIQDAGVNTANTFDGISSAIVGMVISGNTIFSGANKTRYGVSITAGSNVTTTGNNLSGNVTGAYSNTSGGTSVLYSANIGQTVLFPWTPALTFDSALAGSFTYTQQLGNYSVSGNIVTANFALTWSAIPSAGMTMLLNLPVATNRTASVMGYVSSVGGITFTGTNAITGGTMVSIASNTTTTCSIVTSKSGAGYSDPLQQTALTAAVGNLNGVITYEIAS